MNVPTYYTVGQMVKIGCHIRTIIEITKDDLNFNMYMLDNGELVTGWYLHRWGEW